MSLLFSIGANNVLVEYAIVNAGLMLFTMLSGLELHHKLMRKIPGLLNHLERIKANTMYVRKISILGSLGSVVFVFWLQYHHYSYLFMLLVLFVLSFLSLEFGRMLRANGYIIEASKLDYFKTITEGILLVVLLSVEISLFNIYVASILSLTVSLFLLRRKILDLLAIKDFLRHSNSADQKWLKIDYNNIFLLVGALCLRYIQIYDRQLLELSTNTEVASQWILLMGLSMFVYRAVDSMLLQFALPSLIKAKKNISNYSLVSNELIRRTILWSLLWSLAVGFGSVLYVWILSRESFEVLISYIPFALLVVFGLVIFTLSNTLYFSIGSLRIYPIFGVLSLLVLLGLSSLMSISFYSLSLLVFTGYFLVSILVFSLWRREMRLL